MRLGVTVVDPLVGERADLLLDADADVPIAVVAQHFAQLFRAESQDAVALYVEGNRIEPSLNLKDSPLREGSIVALDVPVGWCEEPTGVVEVRVVSGPGAGVVYALGVGEHRVPLEGPDVLEIAVAPDGGCTVAGPSGEGEWLIGTTLRVGESLLELARPTPSDASLRASQDGYLEFNRPPRLLPPPTECTFTLPDAPREEEKRPLPLLMGLAPLVMAVASAVVYRQMLWLLMGLLSPILLVANHLVDRKRGRTSFRRKEAAYRVRRAAVEQEVQQALVSEESTRRGESPDPCVVLLTALGPRRRLWERRRDDPDHLLLRVGTADLPSRVVLEDPAQERGRRQMPLEVHDVPVTIPLAQRGVVGIAGPDDRARAVVRWLIAQLAVLHSPADVQLWLLTSSDQRAQWEWVRWLPHARAVDGHDATVLVGNDVESLARRIGELAAIVDARTKARSVTGTLVEPDIVVVMDGARDLRCLPGVVQILRDGPAVRVFTICLDTEERMLPAECQATVLCESVGLRVQAMLADAVDAVRPDVVSPAWCERLSRALASVRDVSAEREEAVLPGSARLLDVLELPEPTADAIAARWTIGGRTTRAPIGLCAEGIFAIDMKSDGPHGLVAGTTGSGKSELLQSIVASLAVGNRPDALTFVLVDYKGGSAFSDCARLPHTVGMVTDLDAHLVERALTSLAAELKRREHVLGSAGAKDIEDYIASHAAARPLPRLLIVIDEFASLVRELPDFVTGLVDIAQRGRSLGIHLLLATQRPSGVVSPEVRANTNLRIALRVTDDAESFDIIDAPDAARIAKSTPGRGLARLGHTSVVSFQVGRVGGRRPGAPSGEPVHTVRLGWEELGRPLPLRTQEPNHDEVTDLKVLVEAICGANALLGVEQQHSPWLPPLPELLLLDDVPASEGTAGAIPPVVYGVDDVPSEQARRPAVIDFASFGHLLAAGAPRSGRSQLLRTIAGAMARTVSCSDVHLYGIDCGNGALLPLADLPHCGAVVTRTENERALRLIGRLCAEMDRRQEVLAAQGFADIAEQRAAVPENLRLPHIVVLLDRWEGFTSTIGELDGGELLDAMLRVLREGASVGLHLVITGDRSLLSGRIATLAEEKVAFRLSDRSDFSFLGLMARNVPEDLPAGRFLRSESGIECQVALLHSNPSGQAQARTLADIAAKARSRDIEVPDLQRPFRVDALPTHVTFDDVWSKVAEDAGPLFGLVGIGGDALAALGPDLGVGSSTFVVAGPRRSGRSTLLLSMARSFLAVGTQVIVVAPQPSPLRQLGSAPGVVAVFTGADLSSSDLQAALDSLRGPGAILIDDAELLKSCAAGDVLANLCRHGIDSHRALVLAGDVESVCSGFSGWQLEAKKGRRGALLGPHGISDGDLIGVRLPRRAAPTGQQTQPGRALLHLGDGELITVQVPLS